MLYKKTFHILLILIAPILSLGFVRGFLKIRN